MNNEKLAKYLSVSLWGISEDRMKELLDDFEEHENKEAPPTKHPIELVNERYPNGWYCEAFEEVWQDVRKKLDKYCHWSNIMPKYLAYDKSNINNGFNGWALPFEDLQEVTKSEYLSITRPTEQWEQRDYTGVRFEHKDGMPFDGGIIVKLENGIYTINYPYSRTGSCKVEDFNVNRFFEKGIWIELPPETSSIHVEKPNPLEDRVKALEDRLERLEQGSETPTLKRNLPIDNGIYKKVGEFMPD